MKDDYLILEQRLNVIVNNFENCLKELEFVKDSFNNALMINNENDLHKNIKEISIELLNKKEYVVNNVIPEIRKKGII